MVVDKDASPNPSTSRLVRHGGESAMDHLPSEAEPGTHPPFPRQTETTTGRPWLAGSSSSRQAPHRPRNCNNHLKSLLAERGNNAFILLLTRLSSSVDSRPSSIGLVAATATNNNSPNTIRGPSSGGPAAAVARTSMRALRGPGSCFRQIYRDVKNPITR